MKKTASTQIQLRVTDRRKAAYKKAAASEGKKLSSWVFSILDAVANYSEER